MKDSIDPNWRPPDWCRQEEAFERGATGILQHLAHGDSPPGIEDIAAVVARVKERHHLVELADDQEPPLYHSDYRDKELYYVICQALKDAGFKKVKL